MIVVVRQPSRSRARLLDGGAEDAFEAVLVNYRRDCGFGIFRHRTDNTPGTVDEDITIRAQDGSRKNDAEMNYGADGKNRFCVEQDAACGDIGGFGEMLTRVVGADRNGKPEGKSD